MSSFQAELIRDIHAIINCRITSQMIRTLINAITQSSTVVHQLKKLTNIFQFPVFATG